jgi:HK97 family phage prohead protease|tara:strand:- start:3069 stop:4469 length:1401 start_codon:yes stop_codon:yes gene_type:complete
VLSQERLYGVDESIGLLKAGNDLVVAGYASVELVDKQGDLITKEALKDGFRKFMSDPKYRNVQLAHSNIQVGEVVPSYTDTEGRLWKSEVDDVGMFVVIQLRDDIEKAREVAAEIRKGKLRGFSIGGQAFKRVRKSDPRHGDYQEISKLELHEITICEKGINPEATFRILKQETDSENTEEKVKKMTEENDMQTQLGDVLARLETRLDSMEKAMPPQLKEAMKDKKDDKDDKDKAMADKKDDDKDEKMYADEAKKSDEYSDVISSEYLDWMENTLKSAGVDVAGARGHFDDLAKANLGSTPEEFDLDYGQTPNRESENGKPSTNAIARLGGKGEKKEVKKSDFLTPDLVSEADVEAAYEVYKAAAMEQEFRGSLESRFADRFAAERAEEIAKAEAAAYDARGPLDEVMKALGALNERIDNIGTVEAGTPIAKSEAEPAVEIPSTVDMHRMSWDEVHALADKAFRGE